MIAYLQETNKNFITITLAIIIIILMSNLLFTQNRILPSKACIFVCRMSCPRKVETFLVSHS